MIGEGGKTIRAKLINTFLHFAIGKWCLNIEESDTQQNSAYKDGILRILKERETLIYWLPRVNPNVLRVILPSVILSIVIRLSVILLNVIIQSNID